MAAIVQHDPYQNLIRKIGYSVGLESLLERVLSLVDSYVALRGLSLVAFRELVENEFKRKKNAWEHFADVYGTLNLVKLVGTGIHPLHNLETLSILRRYLTDNDAVFISAAKIVLTQAILEADGDIFLNALASDFEPQSFKLLVVEMVKKKRQLIRNVIKSTGALKKIYSIIDIKSQPSQKGRHASELVENNVSKFAKRTESLDIVKRTTPLSDGISEEVDVPEDYLRKVPVTRKGWAEDLSLFENGQKTVKGSNLLEMLDKYLHAKQETGCYVLWPYSKDLAQLQIRPKDIGSPDINPWLLICAIAKGIGNVDVEPYDSKRDYSQVMAQLKEFHRLYQRGNITYGSIRHQLPLYIAEPSIVALYSANLQSIPPLPDIVDAEAKENSAGLIELSLAELKVD